MKLSILFIALAVSTSAFANKLQGPPVGEDSRTSGSSIHCCPTGGCQDKTLPLCAGVVQTGQKLPGFQSNTNKTNSRKARVDGI